MFEAVTSEPPTGDSPRPFEEYERVLAEAELLLDDVDLALRRIRDGSYRTCEACGQTIPPERLAVEPTARQCSSHADEQSGPSTVTE